MINQPIPLTPTKVSVLAQCPLHYHFLQQETEAETGQTEQLVREGIQALHAAGGPPRLSLTEYLDEVAPKPDIEPILKNYYQRLEQDWPQMMAGNETMQLKISIGGVSLLLECTVDRLDKTSDDGILAILFRVGDGPLPDSNALRLDHANTIYHALVASTYPLKRPVRIQEWWLKQNEQITFELSEDEYRQKLSDIRKPVQALARGEVMARPGLHCDTCPYQHHGCPVYAHEADDTPDTDDDPQQEPDDFVLHPADGKMSSRKWIFKI